MWDNVLENVFVVWFQCLLQVLGDGVTFSQLLKALPWSNQFPSASHVVPHRTCT